VYLPLSMLPPALVIMPKGWLTVATDPEPVAPAEAFSAMNSCALMMYP
jgi:hypothetical protein